MSSRPRLATDAAALAAGGAGRRMPVRPGPRARRQSGLGESAPATYMPGPSGAIPLALGITLIRFSIARAIATA